eukprot:gene8528-biopygen6132
MARAWHAWRGHGTGLTCDDAGHSSVYSRGNCGAAGAAEVGMKENDKIAAPQALQSTKKWQNSVAGVAEYESYKRKAWKGRAKGNPVLRSLVFKTSSPQFG